MRKAQSEKGTGLLDSAMLVPAIIISGGNLKGKVYKNICHTAEFSKTNLHM
jgi:hypothetical protein